MVRQPVFVLMPPPPVSTLFPYTTLFRSTAARLERLEARGLDGFSHYLVPNAALKLKQGFGRLKPCLSLSAALGTRDRKSTRLNSSHANISYDVFCVQKKKACSHD